MSQLSWHYPQLHFIYFNTLPSSLPQNTYKHLFGNCCFYNLESQQLVLKSWSQVGVEQTEWQIRTVSHLLCNISRPCIQYKICSYADYQESLVRCTNSPDTAIKHARPEGNAVTHICKKKVSFHLSLHSHICTKDTSWYQAHAFSNHLWGEVRAKGEEGPLTQHCRANVHANPVVPLFRDKIPTQPRAAAEGRKGW